MYGCLFSIWSCIFFVSNFYWNTTAYNVSLFSLSPVVVWLHLMLVFCLRSFIQSLQNSGILDTLLLDLYWWARFSDFDMNCLVLWYFLHVNLSILAPHLWQLCFGNREKTCYPITSPAPYIGRIGFCCGWIKCTIWKGFSPAWKACGELAFGSWLPSIWTIFKYFPN